MGSLVLVGRYDGKNRLRTSSATVNSRFAIAGSRLDKRFRKAELTDNPNSRDDPSTRTFSLPAVLGDSRLGIQAEQAGFSSAI